MYEINAFSMFKRSMEFVWYLIGSLFTKTFQWNVAPGVSIGSILLWFVIVNLMLTVLRIILGIYINDFTKATPMGTDSEKTIMSDGFSFTKRTQNYKRFGRSYSKTTVNRNTTNDFRK